MSTFYVAALVLYDARGLIEKYLLSCANHYDISTLRFHRLVNGIADFSSDLSNPKLFCKVSGTGAFLWGRGNLIAQHRLREPVIVTSLRVADFRLRLLKLSLTQFHYRTQA